MRVDLSLIPGQGDLKIKTGAGSVTNSLNKGDRVKADVISSDKDAAVLKTEGGQTFRARLDSDVTLSAGDKVTLEVVGKENGVLALAIREDNAGASEAAAQQGLVRDFDDKSLAVFADKLAELKMPVTEEAARAMRELIAQNPGITLDEAAFLVSNKLTGDPNLIKAALAILSDGEKTDAMISRLQALLSEFPAPPEGSATGSTAPGTAALPAQEPSPAAPAAPPTAAVPAQTAAGEGGAIQLTDLLGQLLESLRGAAEDPAPGKQIMGQIIPQEIIPQSEPDLQSRISTNNVEISQDKGLNAQQPVAGPQNPGIQPLPLSVETEIRLPNPESAGPGAPPAEGAAQPAAPPAIAGPAIAPAPESAPESAGAAAQAHAPAGESAALAAQPDAAQANKAFAEILSGIPEFRGAPMPALERFSNMLLKVAAESAGKPGAGASLEKLSELLDKLFTRIEKSGKDSGERLKSAKEELFARLTLLEETISRAAPPAKAEMLDQTRKLMDHVRLLNSIDQFVYMQLPVKMGEENRTAELYLFKRKNGKRVDPDNVNILLALDLENMGHWEGLINIRNKDVSIQMEVPGAAEKEYFSEKTVILHDMLAEAGYKLVSAGITYSKNETTPLTALSALDRYTNGRRGMIDFMI